MLQLCCRLWAVGGERYGAQQDKRLQLPVGLWEPGARPVWGEAPHLSQAAGQSETLTQTHYIYQDFLFYPQRIYVVLAISLKLRLIQIFVLALYRISLEKLHKRAWVMGMYLSDKLWRIVANIQPTWLMSSFCCRHRSSHYTFWTAWSMASTLSILCGWCLLFSVITI